MRIENVRSERAGNRARVSASVQWEDCDRPSREVYFEVDDAFAEDLSCNPHAFLVGCLLPAMRHGEKRIAIDEAICPELRNGLLTAMGWVCHWYGSPWKPIPIEAKTGVRPPALHATARAGSFLSGGVDSLATLRANRVDFPLDHPSSIKDCLVVHGFDIGGLERSGGEMGLFQRALAALSPATQDAEVTLIPVFTNVRHLDDDVDFWINQFFGAALSAVAHALSNRLTRVSIACGLDIPNVEPHGSHPLLDPNYSSADLSIRHDGVRFSRLEKAKLVGDWDAALHNLRVCTWNPSEMLNCGKCEKCIRTMLELLAVGKLTMAKTFPVNDVSTEMVGSIEITTTYLEGLYRELISPLRARGRNDLATVIEDKSVQFHKHLAWVEERDWKGAVKRFDRRYLRSSLFNSYKVIRERTR